MQSITNETQQTQLLQKQLEVQQLQTQLLQEQLLTQQLQAQLEVQQLQTQLLQEQLLTQQLQAQLEVQQLQTQLLQEQRAAATLQNLPQHVVAANAAIEPVPASDLGQVVSAAIKPVKTLKLVQQYVVNTVQHAVSGDPSERTHWAPVRNHLLHKIIKK